MPFVLDASIALTWCFEDESGAASDAALERLESDSGLVPTVWPLEVANALVVSEHRQRLDAARTARFTELLASLPIVVEPALLDRALGGILDLARAYRLSSYDASYLELAMRHGVQLATQDVRLAEAAAQLGVPLLA